MSAKASKKSDISFPYLRRFNGIMSGVHLVQAVLMLFAGLSIASISRFRLPLTSSYLSYDVAAQRLVSLARHVGSLQIGPIVSSFLFLSALFHLLTVSRLHEQRPPSASEEDGSGTAYGNSLRSCRECE
jgi:hypothetical protein